MKTSLPVVERTLTELDHIRLKKLAERLGEPAAALDDDLDSADLVPSRAVPPDVVTMYSRVQLAEAGVAETRTLTVCFPHDADPAAGRVSVLSPVGEALLGRRIGAFVHWHTPDGAAHEAQIIGLDYQPEASGDYTT